ncbi:MAG: DUF502 domain-containing protein [Rhodospirillaceae bacterium]
MKNDQSVPNLPGLDKHPPAGPPIHVHKLGWIGRFRAYFLAGVLVTAPAAITIYLAWLFINFIDSAIGTILPARYNPEQFMPFTIPGLGLVMVVVLLILVGAFAAGYVGRLVVRLGEGVVEKMPVVRHIYSAIKQIFETVLAQQSTAFRDVVLLEYPRIGVWSLGFITGPATSEIQRVSGEDLITVVIPTSPIPTAGFLIFVPRKELVVLDMTVEEGLKVVMSGGIVSPPDRRRRPVPSAL